MEHEYTLLDVPVSAEKKQSFEELVMKAKYCMEAGAYEKAVAVYEEARSMDPAKEAEIVIPLAKACRECGKEFDAIHWFRIAINEYGKKEYEKELMQLYQTGVVGIELKEKADKYFG